MSESTLFSSLAGVRRRVRVLSLIHGAGFLLAAVIGLLLATVFLDYILNLPPVPRVVVMLSAMVCAGWAFVRWVARPLTAKLRLTDVAGKIEQTFPLFDDRLRSAINFSRHPSPESEVMKQRVMAQATTLAGQVDLRGVVRPEPAIGAVAAGAGAALLCALLAWMVGTDYLSTAMSRLISPFADRAWPKWTQISLVGQVPARVAAGTPVDVKMKLTKGDRLSAKAIVYYQYEVGGPVQQELMTRNADGSYTASLDTRLEQGKSAGMMNMWMTSGDDRKDLPAVKVLPPLTIHEVEAVVTPPKYAQMPPVTMDLAAAPATVTVGSTVELRVNFSKPLAIGKPVHLEAASSDTPLPAVQWDANAGDAYTAVGSFAARQTAHFRIIATDQDGFSNNGIEEYQILVRPDQLPSVQFEKPVRNEETTADASISIQGVAQDDFGIKTMQLMVHRLGDNKNWTLDLIQAAKPASDDVQWRKLDGSGDLLRFRMNWDWDLSKLADAKLKAGDQLEFYLRVQDNYEDDQGRPHDPPYSESGRLRVTIISAESLTEQLTDQLSQLRAQVEETRRQNEAVRSGTKGLQQDTANKANLDRADRAMANQLANDQSGVASQTKQIADRLGEMQNRMAQNRLQNPEMQGNIAEAQRLLNDAAENPMQSAASRLSAVANQKGDQQQPDDQSGQQGEQPNNQSNDQQQTDQQQGDQQSGQQSGQRNGQQNNQRSGQRGNPQSGQRGNQQQGNQQQGNQQSGQQQSGQQQSGQQQSGQQGNQQQQQIQQPRTAQERDQTLSQTQQQQADATQQLQRAMDKMGQDAGLSQYLKQVSQLLDQQRDLSRKTSQAGRNTLGKDPSQLTDQEKKEQQDLSNQQQDLARQADQAMNNMNKAADQQQRTDQPTAQALRQAAQTGQQQNVSGQMNQAAQAEQQNQQANAQQDQRQAEIGLMMMLNQLKDAENRRLMELMKQLETAQELVGDLIEQQAGHNLDNLALQGGTAMVDAAKAAPDLMNQLIDASGRDPAHLPAAPPIESQIALQAQTERNARSVVTVIAALPEGADPAQDLTRAAQRMARAVSYLQDQKLTDAYQPPQVEAFAALLAVKEALDKQTQQAQQNMQNQRKETLRQQFVAIRDAQVKINEQTKAIDATPRTADGQLGHTARANVGIASDQQNELSQKTAKLNDDLTSIGSVAYVYANTDIAARMSAAGQALGKLDPGAVTQKTQARAVEELDDMIKNLTLRPRQSNFSNPRQGQQQQGAGQQGQPRPPRLPPEAELRLIQDMQKMLNEDTKDADAAGGKDKPGILDLGKRQGDLRNLLDNLLKQASDGQASLGPEPENKASLPEEASSEDLDLQELKDSALNAKPDEQGIKDDTSMVGIRMTRARQRLALDADPGKTTQKIQERIVIEMDSLANMAQQQQAQAQPGQQRGQRPARQGQGQPGQQAGNQPGNDQANGQRQGQNQPAPAGRGPQSGGNTAGLQDNPDINAQVAELKESWGKLSPRQRAAVMEGSTDQTLQKFKDFVDGYYRTLATKNQQQDSGH